MLLDVNKKQPTTFDRRRIILFCNIVTKFLVKFSSVFPTLTQILSLLFVVVVCYFLFCLLKFIKLPKSETSSTMTNKIYKSDVTNNTW